MEKAKMQDTIYQYQNTLHDTMRINSALRDRRVYLNNEITRETIFEIIYLLDRIKTIDDMEELEIPKRKPIEIIIDSYGGMCYHGLTLLAKMQTFKDMGYQIITTTIGVGMSMAFMTGLIGSNRRAYRYARFMCHQPSGGTFGTLREMEKDTDESKYIWDLMKEIIIDHTDITEEMLDKIYREKEDRYYSPQEALELKIIDEII